MRVFITGATGFIGSAVVNELIGAGHQVLGLARSDAGAKQLTAAGAAVQRGSLEDLDSLKRGASESEGVIHLAFIHDFTDFAANCAKDKAAIEALGGVLAGSNRPLVVSSGVLGLAQGRSGTEEDVPTHAFPRKSEETGLSFASKGVRASVIRLSLLGPRRRRSRLRSATDPRRSRQGLRRVRGRRQEPLAGGAPARRRPSLPPCTRERHRQGRYHGVADEGVPIRDIAEIIGKRLNVPALSKSAEEVVGALCFIGQVLAMDAPSSSKLTQERLGWRPTQPGLVADLEKGTYFDAK